MRARWRAQVTPAGNIPTTTEVLFDATQHFASSGRRPGTTIGEAAELRSCARRSGDDGMLGQRMALPPEHCHASSRLPF